MDATTETLLAIGKPANSTDSSRDELRKNVNALGRDEYKEPEAKEDGVGEEADTGSLKSQSDDKSQPVADSTAKVGDKKPDTKTEEVKSPQQKNAERKGKTWEQINAEKEIIAAEKKAIADEKEKVQREKEEWQRQREESAPIPRTKDNLGYTAEEYDRYAEQFEKDGDYDNAKLCQKNAKNLRAEDQKVEAQFKQKRFESELQRHIQEARKEVQDELKQDILDQNSDAFKGVSKVLQEIPELTRIPNGIKYAVKAWKLQQAGSKASELEKTVETQKVEIESLRKKLSVGGSQASDSRDYGDKDFNSMSTEEQRAFLRKKMKD